jgi:hypothetical protein
VDDVHVEHALISIDLEFFNYHFVCSLAMRASLESLRPPFLF